MGKLLPIILALSGLLGGLGAGYAFKPPEPECPSNTSDQGRDATGDALSDSESTIEPAAVTEPAADCAANAKQGDNRAGKTGEGDASGLLASSEFAKLPTQFVVPVLDEGRMRALVVLSVSLEVVPGTQEMVFSLEPKLRDAFLKVMFRHANSGGFDGNFTDRRAMEDLRGSLYQAAEAQLGDKLLGILILDIVRQDVG